MHPPTDKGLICGATILEDGPRIRAPIKASSPTEPAGTLTGGACVTTDTVFNH